MNRNRLFLGLMFLVGCATPREMFDRGGHGYKPGVEKAAFDLDCPKEQLEVVELGHIEFGVKGPGGSLFRSVAMRVDSTRCPRIGARRNLAEAAADTFACCASVSS